jgi:hypothetical protein
LFIFPVSEKSFGISANLKTSLTLQPNFNFGMNLAFQSVDDEGFKSFGKKTPPKQLKQILFE